MSDEAIVLKQPPVLKLAFFTAMCERFGFYVLSFLVVLYAKGEFHYSDSAAFALFSVFTALAYLTPALGGYLADNFFGIRRCIITGLFLEGIGLCLLAVPDKTFFTFALALIAIGVGLFKTGPTHLMGRSYREKDPRIDSGFTLYYMGINIGSFICSLIIGEVQRRYGWGTAFVVGGIATLLGLVCYFFLKHTAAEIDSEPGNRPLPIVKWLSMVVGIIIVVFGCSYFIYHATVAQAFILTATAILLIYFAFEIIRSPAEEKIKIVACLSLIVIGFIFYVLYFQAYTSIVLFINRSVARVIYGFEVPTVAYFALNPFWVIVLGPILAWIYTSLGKRGKDLAVTTKFAIGIFVTSISFFALVAGAYFPSATGTVSSWWTVLAYFFYTLGEMLVAALGVAMVTHIAPKRMFGVMQGAWFLMGLSLAAATSGLFADLANVPDTLHDPFMILNIYKVAFLKIGIGSLICAILAFIVGPYIRRIAKI